MNKKEDKKVLEIPKVSRYYIVLLIMTIFIVVGCTQVSEQSETNRNTKLKVTVTFFPLYDITKSIAGDYAEVRSIIPINVEPHDYEPTPGQLAQISESKIVVLLGVGFDNVENKITNNVKWDTIIVKSTKDLDLVQSDPTIDEGNGMDQHIWLSPKRMIVVAMNVKNALKQADPEHESEYEKNAQDYINRLNELDEEYEMGLRNCSKSAILTSHSAFGYLAKDYGFRQISISGLSPDSEPSPQKLAELVDVARKENITYVFYEDLVDPKVSQTIAGEVGAKTLPLSPLEGTKNKNDDYFSIMKENLNSIKLARGCS